MSFSGTTQQIAALLTLVGLTVSPAFSQSPIISTVAGGYTGDGGPAIRGQLSSPFAVAVARDGTLYIADTGNHRIRRVGVDGKISTVAGNGSPGFSGDGGPASSAQLSSPRGVAVAGDGTLYIGDSKNHRIRRVGVDGKITTFAGTGSVGSNGDGGPASGAQLDFPEGLALAGDGTLYIADSDDHRIRRVGADGKISTVAGTGSRGFSGDGGQAFSAQLDFPEAVAVTGDGTLYIADTFNDRIRRVGVDGKISTVAGTANTTGTRGFGGDGGPASSAELSLPSGVAVAGDGTFYIADFLNNRIRRVGVDGKISTVAGTGSSGFSGDNGLATSAQVSYPDGVAVAGDGTLYIVDSGNNSIRRVGADGKISTIAGSCCSIGDGGPASSALLNYPVDVAVASDGTLYIADDHDNRIRRVGTDGKISTVAGTGPAGFSGDGGPASGAQLYLPTGVAIAGDGTLYIADFANHRIRRVGTDGKISTIAGTGSIGSSGDGGLATGAELFFPRGVAVAGDGTLYIAETGGNRIRRVGVDGKISTIAGTGISGFSGDGGIASAAQLSSPSKVAVGGDGTLYIADFLNNRIRRVGLDGKISTVAGIGSGGFSGDGGQATVAALDGPDGVAVAGDGTLYIAEFYNHRIRRVDVDGKISTFAGTGSSSFGGDGGPASSAQLNSPRGIAIAGDGSLYIADTVNNRIRKVTFATANPLTITSLSPSSAVAGFPQFTLTVNGTGFTSLSAVLWDGTLLATSSVTSTQLTAIVRASLIATAGTAAVTVNSVGVGTSNPLTFTISPPQVTTTSVTVDTFPSGRSAIVDGATITTPRTFSWAASSAHTLDVPSPQGAGTTRYNFDHWSQGGLKAQTITTPTSTITYTATLTAQYQLTTTATPSNGGTLTASPSSADGFYTDSTQVRLTATAASGYTFTNFSGDLSGSTNAQTLTMTGPKSVAANFTANQVNTKITISSNPLGRTILVDGTSTTTPADFTWAPASTHTLDVQNPQVAGFTRYVFDQWSNGASLSQTITTPSTPATYLASFITQHLVSILPSPSDGGSIAQSPTSTDGFYNEGTQLQVTAAPKANFTFANFSGDLTGATNPQTLAINVPKNATANFTPAAPPLTSTPAQLTSLTATQGSNAIDTLQISGGAPGQSVAVTVDQPWLRVNPSQGVPPFTVSVVAASSGLAPDTYPGNVILGGTLQVPIKFQVTQRATSPQLTSDALAVGLQFNLYVGIQKPPAQTINVRTSDGSPLAYTAAVKYLQGTSGWVKLSPTRGQTPSSLSVDLNIQTLTPGTFTANLVLSATGSPDLVIPITLSYVKPPSQSQILVDRQEITLDSAGDKLSTAVLVKNSGAGTLPFTVSFETEDGSKWLTVSPPNGGSAVDQSPAELKVSADPAKLAPPVSGTYRGTLSITDNNGNTTKIPVIFAYTASKTLKVVLTGLTLQIGAGYTDFPPQAIELVSYGNAAVSWSAESNVSWIKLSPASGSLTPKTVGGPQVTFELSQLVTGLNTGLVTIKSDAAGGDQIVKVSVSKAPVGVAINRLQPLSLVFVPPFKSQTVVYVPSTPTTKLTLTPNMSWLTVEDGSGNSSVHTLRITVSGKDLPVGDPQVGAVFIQEPSGQPAALNVLAFAPASGANGKQSGRTDGGARNVSASAACVPTKYITYPTSFPLNFEQNGGAATSTEIFMIDDCGSPVTSAVTGGALGNRDPQLNLRSLGDGRWKATWNPTTPNSYVTLNILGADPDQLLYADPLLALSSVTGSSTDPALAKDQPFETEAGVRLSALSPNMQFRIRGQNFLNSDGTGPTVTLGGRMLSVISSTPSQLVVLTPQDLPVNVEMQLVIQRLDGASVPEPMIVAPTWPAVSGLADAASNQFIVTGLGSSPPESLTADGARIRSVEGIGPGLWRVVSDSSLKGLKLRVRQPE